MARRRYWRRRVKTHICVIRRVTILASLHPAGKKEEKISTATGLHPARVASDSFSLSVSPLSLYPYIFLYRQIKNGRYFSDERSASGTRYDFVSGIRAFRLSFDASYKFGRLGVKSGRKKYALSSFCRMCEPTGRTKVENIFQIYPRGT